MASLNATVTVNVKGLKPVMHIFRALRTVLKQAKKEKGKGYTVPAKAMERLMEVAGYKK